MNTPAIKKSKNRNDNNSQDVTVNRLELLLFRLNSREVYAINVLKVREVTHTIEITRTPSMPSGVEGMTSLRGQLIPVISLASFINNGSNEQGAMNAMMVAEFNGSTQGFLVSEVDRIIGVDWSDIRSPKGVIPGDCNLVTGVTELPGGQIVTILDVEAIQGLALGEAEIPHLAPVASEGRKKFALVVDDSALARKKIAEVLSSMQVDYQMAISGRDALEQLNTIADKAEHAGHQLTDYIDIIMTDAEMPEMDGFSFTKSAKGNPRFRDIPVIMHTSLSSESNRNLGRAVGVDTYIAKFDPEALAGAVRPYLETAHA